jgi:hypothetical protein
VVQVSSYFMNTTGTQVDEQHPSTQSLD